eukprot:g5220.t1
MKDSFPSSWWREHKCKRQHVWDRVRTGPLRLFEPTCNTCRSRHGASNWRDDCRAHGRAKSGCSSCKVRKETPHLFGSSAKHDSVDSSRLNVLDASLSGVYGCGEGLPRAVSEVPRATEEERAAFEEQHDEDAFYCLDCEPSEDLPGLTSQGSTSRAPVHEMNTLAVTTRLERKTKQLIMWRHAANPACRPRGYGRKMRRSMCASKNPRNGKWFAPGAEPQPEHGPDTHVETLQQAARRSLRTPALESWQPPAERDLIQMAWSQATCKHNFDFARGLPMCVSKWDAPQERKECAIIFPRRHPLARGRAFGGA